MTEAAVLTAIEWGDPLNPPTFGVRPGWHSTPGSEIYALVRSDLRLVVEVGVEVSVVALYRKTNADAAIIAMHVRNAELSTLPRLVWAE